MKEVITVLGATEHNLKNISVEIPKHSITSISGPSGSGKTSFAIDTIAAEGRFRAHLLSKLSGRRLSSFVPRQPKVRSVINLPPVLALEKRQVMHSRHTVASFLGLGDLVFPLIREQRKHPCPVCKGQIIRSEQQEILQHIEKNYPDALVAISAFIVRNCEQDSASPRPTIPEQFVAQIRSRGYTRMTIDGKEHDLDRHDLKLPPVDERLLHNSTEIAVIIDRLRVNRENRERITDAIEQALSIQHMGIGICHISDSDDGAYAPNTYYSKDGICSRCGYASFGITRSTLDFKLGVSPDKYQQDLKDLKGLQNLSEIQADELLKVQLEKLSLRDLLYREIAELLPILDGLPDNSLLRPINFLFRTLQTLQLDYLELLRDINSLSPGEWQRIRLTAQLFQPINGLTYVIDEPSIGLHPSDSQNMAAVLETICSQGNTLIVVDHNPQILSKADHSIILGPGPGAAGGQVTYEGSSQATELSPVSGKLASPKNISTEPHGWICLEKASLHNLKQIDVEFPLGFLTCITGVSGSGKTSLMIETLYPALKIWSEHRRDLTGEELASLHLQKLTAAPEITRVIRSVLTGRSKTSLSLVATYVNILSPIRRLYSNLLLSRIRGYSPETFSLAKTGADGIQGRCAKCKGTGLHKNIGMLHDSHAAVCHACRGSRYEQEVRDAKYRGASISDLLQLTVEESLNVIGDIRECRPVLERLVEFNLGYLCLGQPVSTLSSGEFQRLNLVRDLKQGQVGTLYLLDEPTSGLDPAQVLSLVTVLRELVKLGQTVIAIEHNPEFMLLADYIVDLGPAGGRKGGEILAAGTPSTIINCKRSLTGKALQQRLG